MKRKGTDFMKLGGVSQVDLYSIQQS